MTKLDANREAVIVAAARTPVGKAKRGSLATVRPDDMAAEVLRDLVKRVTQQLGLGNRSVSYYLYKLLMYETGPQGHRSPIEFTGN